ncbi:7258_t:CDS:2, partial [Scutellospora calospora]
INPKLSVLNLNSMYFYFKNKEVSDCNVTNSPGAFQLKWLERELQSARDEKRRIYIAQHKSYFPECFDSYVQLLGKYSDVLRGHFT